MKFSIQGFFSKCDQKTADLVTFTEEILNGKLHFLCSVISLKKRDSLKLVNNMLQIIVLFAKITLQLPKAGGVL